MVFSHFNHCPSPTPFLSSLGLAVRSSPIKEMGKVFSSPIFRQQKPLSLQVSFLWELFWNFTCCSVAARELTEFGLKWCFSENERGMCFQSGLYFCFCWDLDLGGVLGFFGGGFLCVCMVYLTGLWGEGVIVFWVGVCWLLLFWAGFFVGLFVFFEEYMHEVTVDQRSWINTNCLEV